MRPTHRRDLFTTDSAKQAFLSTLRETAERLDWLIHSQVNMNNQQAAAFTQREVSPQTQMTTKAQSPTPSAAPSFSELHTTVPTEPKSLNFNSATINPHKFSSGMTLVKSNDQNTITNRHQ